MPKELNKDKKKKYTVWSQGPDDALSKKMKRTFKQTTPGQVRDYAILVKSRSFQKFEQVKRTDEETPANATGSAIANWDPLLGGKKAPTVWLRKKRKMEDKVDGRTRAYRTVTKRIKERNAKAAERETVNKLSQFGVTSNPFREENKMDNKKYLKTKEGSIEESVLDSLNTETPVNPNSLRPTLTLPKNRYLGTKEESVEWSAIKSVAEAHVPGHELPRQLKDPKKEKMVGTKKGTKVVDKDDPRYKKHPEHESVEQDEDLTEKGWFPGMGKKSGDPGKGAASSTSDAETDKSEKKFGKQKEKKRGASSSSGVSKFKFFQKKDKDDQDDDPVGKDTETQTDDDDEDNGKDTETQTSKKNGDDKDNGKMKKKGKKQNLRDKDDEAEGSRSKDRPTAESFSSVLDDKKDRYWAEKKVLQNFRPTAEEIEDDEEEETVIITSLEQLDELDHEEFGFETREEMYEYVEAELQEKKDSRRTADAIDAYDKSKDASRDADWDTEHGKKGKGKKEKKYAKKERDEIDKDDPDWKHKKGHTGMHGEAKDSFVVPSTASSSKTAPGEGGIPKPSDAKIDGDVKNDKKKEHKDAKEVQDIDNREANVGESMSPLMAAVVADISRRESKKKLGEAPVESDTKLLVETSAGGRGERDTGTDAYADYTKNITPGQSAGEVPAVSPSITNDDAKKVDKKQKEANAQKNRQATKIDDEYQIDMPMHELLGIPFTAKARLARQKKKGARIKTRTDLATAKISNIQARDKLKAAKGKLRDARGARNVTAEYQPEEVEVVGEVTMKSKGGSQKLKSGKKVPARWKKMTGDEVKDRLKAKVYAKNRGLKRLYSKPKPADTSSPAPTPKPKSSYPDLPRHTGSIGGGKVKIPDRSASHKKEDMSLAPKGKGKKAAKALYKEGEWADSKAQERKDTAAMLKKHNEREKRYQAQQATDKLSKEDMSLAPKGKGRKAAKRMYGEDISIVDAVQEVLGLGNKWSGMEKMPPVDKKTGKMVTGKSKIIRITDKGKKALKKGDHKLSITAKGRAAVEETEMDEKNWIKGAIKKPGALHRDLDVPQGEKIPAGKLKAAAKEGGKIGQRARLAQTLKKMHNDYVPEDDKGKPEQGKLYALTGRSDQPSIARGDSWKKSVVTKKRKEQDAKKESADARQASVDKEKAAKPVSTKSPRDRAELDAAIAAYKAKGGKTTVLKPKKRKSHQ